VEEDIKRLVRINRLLFLCRHGILSHIIKVMLAVNLPQQNAVHQSALRLQTG